MIGIIVSSLQHIIEFTGVFMDANCRLNIAMEFADRLTLAHRIRVYPGFVPHQARNTTHNIVLGAADSFRRKLYLESSAPIIQRSTLYASSTRCLRISFVLADVHQNHVLHRDIKSSNVFLCTDPLDGSDMVKLGVSKYRNDGFLGDGKSFADLQAVLLFFRGGPYSWVLVTKAEFSPILIDK